MWRHVVFLVLLNPLLLSRCGMSAESDTVLAIQVFDTRDRPIRGVRLRAANGSTGPPSDIAGSTRVGLPPGTQAREEVILILVEAPRNLRFFSLGRTRHGSFVATDIDIREKP
jgi:hypothetical protein